jgi:hypothetical protein
LAARFLPPKLPSWATALDASLILNLANGNLADHHRKADGVGGVPLAVGPLGIGTLPVLPCAL